MKCNRKNKFSEWIAKKAEQYAENVESACSEGTQEEPKRKATPADKERKRLKRQARKEQKRRAIEENQNNQKSAKKNSLNYLYQWHRNREVWTFKKKRQIWLLNRIYDIETINDEDFEILLSYLEQVKGGARKRLLEQAEAIIKGSAEKKPANVESADSVEKTNGAQGSSLHRYQRARMIIQTLV